MCCEQAWVKERESVHSKAVQAVRAVPLETEIIAR